MSGRSSGRGSSGRSSVFSENESSRRRELHELLLSINNENDWVGIHNWFDSNSDADASDAAMFRARDGTTALHLACSRYPPTSVVKLLIDANRRAIDWPDEHGWLPLHYACHHGISEEVLELLFSSNPEAVKVVDKKGRNPLHFAVGNIGKKAGIFKSNLFTSLAGSGAVKVADSKGMIPLHYACAYGASLNTLKILISAHPKSLHVTDMNGFLPLHYAMGNCEREDCAAAVALLLERDHGVKNIDFEHKQHPLYVLGNRANKFLKRKTKSGAGQANALNSMNLFLDLGPMPTTNFFAALHTMPTWLLEKAVVHPKVQELLNDRISKRFPTTVMMVDFYALFTVLISFAFLSIEFIDVRADESSEGGIKSSKLTPLYLCATYFALRELIQVLSFIHLGLFSVWFRRGTNWLEIGLIVLILFWAVVLNNGVMPLSTFRTCAALTTFFFWLNFLNFLRGLLVEFSVFVSGVLFVVRRLGPFLLALIIILVAFMQMFYTIFQGTGYCDGYDNDKSFVDTCDPESAPPYRFCSNWRTFLAVYTMLLGEVDEADFASSKFATFLFVAFVFLVVILLANVLIAIVTDSYSVIRNERAAIVFWTSRLDFIVEMDVISSGVFRNRNIGVGSDDSEKGDVTERADDSNPTILWKAILDIFDKDLNRIEVSMAFLCLVFVRITIIFIIIPMWVAIGLFTAGSAWPDQWRKKLLEQKITIHDSSSQMLGLKGIKQDLDELQRDISTKQLRLKEAFVRLKEDVASIENTITTETKEINEIMATLLDAQQIMIEE